MLVNFCNLASLCHIFLQIWQPFQGLRVSNHKVRISNYLVQASNPLLVIPKKGQKSSVAAKRRPADCRPAADQNGAKVKYLSAEKYNARKQLLAYHGAGAN